ncbi:probable F-actin-capping protein subunit beta [Tanacetum coccineum]
MEGAMGLMRRMPPKHTQTALSALLSLLPDHSADLLSQIDQPLHRVLIQDLFLVMYSLPFGFFKDRVRIVDWSYVTRIVGKNSYCVNTTEMQTLTDGSKYAHGKRGYLHEGGWEAIHVIQVGPDEEGMAHYCLTSTIMLSIVSIVFDLHLQRLSEHPQMKADLSVEDGHLCNMGKMIEELEGKLRNQLDQVYFGKTKEMVCTLRPPSELLSMTLPDSRNP